VNVVLSSVRPTRKEGLGANNGSASSAAFGVAVPVRIFAHVGGYQSARLVHGTTTAVYVGAGRTGRLRRSHPSRRSVQEEACAARGGCRLAHRKFWQRRHCHRGLPAGSLLSESRSRVSTRDCPAVPHREQHQHCLRHATRL
jgi:hypothetical protein